eukprot:3096_1
MKLVVHCPKKCNNKHYSLYLEFARKFRGSQKWTTSKVSFIANRQQSQNEYKVARWKQDPVESGRYIGRNIDPILSCKTPDEIWHFVIHRGRQNSQDIHNAIRKCISMDNLELCWRLFEYAKSKFIVDADVYGQMLWILNHSDIYRNEQKALQIYRQLMNEMESLNIKPNFRLLTAIFSCLTRYQLWDEAHDLWQKLKDAQHELLLITPVWNSYVHLNIKQCLIEPKDNQAHLTTVLQLLDEMYNVYQVKPNDITYGSVISAVSKLLKRTNKFKGMNGDTASHNDVDYIEVGEHLFEQCRVITGHDPYSNVYATMIDLYSNVGNVDRCVELLNIIIDKRLTVDVENQKKFTGKTLAQYKRNGYVDVDDFNERTLRSCFGSTLQAIVNNDEMSYDQGWKLIDHIIQDLFVGKCGLEVDVVTYGLLLHLNASFGKEHINMKKVKKMYKQMLKDGVKPNNLALNNLTMVGRLKYEDDKKKSDKFAKFILKEFHRHKIPLPRVLQVKLNSMMVYHDDGIKYMIRKADSV